MCIFKIAGGELKGELIGGQKMLVGRERIHAAAVDQVLAAVRIPGLDRIVEDVPVLFVEDIKARAGIFHEITDDFEGAFRGRVESRPEIRAGKQLGCGIREPHEEVGGFLERVCVKGIF